MKHGRPTYEWKREKCPALTIAVTKRKQGDHEPPPTWSYTLDTVHIMKRTGKTVDDDERGRAGKDRVSGRAGGLGKGILYMQHNLGSLFSLSLFLRNSTTTQAPSPHLQKNPTGEGREESRKESEPKESKQASGKRSSLYIHPSTKKGGRILGLA